ncbi:MAG: hypothetical protein JWM18_790, partial [Chloroflexi bacterium]|nr:hypothetical protein [Chloroflexota bacterium]
AFLLGPRPVDPSRQARDARVAGECRRGGGQRRHRARQRTMSCARRGEAEPPPGKDRRQSGPPRISTGGRTAGHLHPVTDRPCITTRDRSAGHPHPWQNCRASPPAADRPGIPTRGRSAGHLHRRQNCRASPPGGRSAEHPHRRQIGRATAPAADRPSNCPGGTSAEQLPRRQIRRAPPPVAEQPSRPIPNRASARYRSPRARVSTLRPLRTWHLRHTSPPCPRTG